MSEDNSVAIIDESAKKSDNESDSQDLYPPLLNGDKYFRVKEEKDGKIVAICLTCEDQCKTTGDAGIKIEFKGTRQTKSNFITHLSRRHAKLHQDYEKENPPKRRRISQHKFELINLSQKQTLSDELLFTYLIDNYYSPYTINEDFVNMIKNLNSQIQVPSAQDLIRGIQRKANDVQQNIIKILESTSYISFTASALKMDEVTYLIVAGFWLDTTDLSRQNALLSCNACNCIALDSGYILNVVHDVIMEYGIPISKVSSIIINDNVEYNKDLANFMNDPSSRSENHYVIPSSHASEIIGYPEIIILEREVHDLDLANSIVYDIMKFALADFISLLADYNKLEYHYKVFSKINKIWNTSVLNSELIESICKKKIEGPSVSHIGNLHNALNNILEVRDKLNTLAKNCDHVPFLNESEINYIEEVTNYLGLIYGAIKVIETDQNGYFGIVAPIITSLYTKFKGKLKFTQLSDIYSILLVNLQCKFSKYLTYDTPNTSMFGGCFNSRLKLDWLSMDCRDNIKAMCKQKILEEAPIADENAESNPLEDDYILMRPAEDLTNNSLARKEAAKYFDEKRKQTVEFIGLPIIKQLFVEYNSINCNPTLVKALIEHTKLLKCVGSKISLPISINCYVIINAQKSKNLKPEKEE